MRPRSIGWPSASTTTRVSSQSHSSRVTSLGGSAVPSSSVAGGMLVSASTISDFVERHPTVKMLALSFLLMIGFTLLVEGLGQHISKGYIYAAMGFSIFVEALNLRLRKSRSEPVELKAPYVGEAEGSA